MARITIEELYRGEKYGIMSAVAVKAMTLGMPNRISIFTSPILVTLPDSALTDKFPRMK